MARIRADRLLVERGLFESRAKAQAAIAAGRITAGGRTVRTASELLDSDADLKGEPAFPWVGRAAIKLAHALSLWPVSADGRIVVDLGASTGGFTEVCLQGGAERIYAVDVGRGQLHPRLVGHPRVVSLEAVDARTLDAALVPQSPDLIVGDLSFISLPKALPAALALAAPDADLIVLVKPQFEVGPERVGKGGLVKDPAVQAQAVEDVRAWLEGRGWSVEATAESPIQGGDGNREFLLWARRG